MQKKPDDSLIHIMTLKIFAIALLMSSLAGCSKWQTEAIETDPVSKEICWTWGSNLPTRSRRDTGVTQSEIENEYAAFSIACPDNINLIPE